MGKNREYFIEDLLKSTEGLIEEINVENLKACIQDDASEKIVAEPYAKDIL